MRTRLLIVVIVLFIGVAGYVIYFGFLAPPIPSGAIRFNTSTDGAYRSLIKQQNWDTFSPNTFRVARKLNYSLQLKVALSKKDSIQISINLIPLSNDSVKVIWYAVFPNASASPVVKLTQWSQYDDVKHKMDDALGKFQQFVTQNENIYGTRIEETSTKDTLLIATRFTSHAYPSTELIYSNINKLKSYANSTGASESGSPMLNVSSTDSSSFNCMVALPINKVVAEKGDVFFVRMVPGHFLRTEVTGGPFTINHAHRMMDQYFKDFNRVSMAIRFESLITDRQKQTDTTKWVTRIYGPVY